MANFFSGLFRSKNEQAKTRRDVRDFYPQIDKDLTMLYTTGSVEVQCGLYEEEIDERMEKFRNYSFVG